MEVNLSHCVTVGGYIESVENNYEFLRTLRILSYTKDIDGRPRVWCGNRSAIFKVDCGQGDLMLKCYVKPSVRGKEICAYLEGFDDLRYLRRERWLDQEILSYTPKGEYVYCDVAVAEWIDGPTLEYEIRKWSIYEDKQRLKWLAQEFLKLSKLLLSMPWAHGDLKPENIIVADDKLVVLDYDAVYIPSFEGLMTDEIGTPGFQHPARDQYLFNKHIDDYSIALIITILCALSLDPTLYQQKLCYDLCLLSPIEIVEHRSELFNRVVELFDKYGLEYNVELALTLRSEQPTILRLAEILEKIEI